MPLPHLTRHAGLRLLATGAIAAVAVVGTPAIASAQDNPLVDVPVVGGLLAPAQQTPVVPGTSGLPSLPGLPSSGADLPGAGGLPNPADSISAGAACVQGLVTGIQVTVTGIADGLRDALIGLLGGGGTSVPVVDGTASTTLPMTPEELAGLLDLSPERLAQLLADGQQSLETTVEVVIGGVAQTVGVVVDFVKCLASLIPAPAATTPPATTPAPQPAAPTTTAPVTTQAPQTQAVAYPGYAPTGGQPSDDDQGVEGLAALGLLGVATGGGALWLRARRGVAG
ncbi:hypothetical protein SAMN03159343_0745 [Klenkia marina]|uniref:LPXTG-motif cell wall anchor domain-containing protein n=1 Tax=Klenkia marina TaxID=1960309 RepID=A0A1G4XET9_9ACTN|nr:hypothetical protein [Klenkia marina]SCX39691.1 hypothetical protein SAMN03159343_0745 [Klenkia marina]